MRVEDFHSQRAENIYEISGLCSGFLKQPSLVIRKKNQPRDQQNLPLKG